MTETVPTVLVYIVVGTLRNITKHALRLLLPMLLGGYNVLHLQARTMVKLVN